MNAITLPRAAIWLLRIALACSFFSAVADRFGLWGNPGSPQVAWGDWRHFVAYTAKLLWFLPQPLVPLAAWAATIAEVVLGLALLSGRLARVVALTIAGLLTSFAVTMTVALGIKAPLDYSVFTAAAAALVLAAITSPKRENISC